MAQRWGRLWGTGLVGIDPDSGKTGQGTGLRVGCAETSISDGCRVARWGVPGLFAPGSGVAHYRFPLAR